MKENIVRFHFGNSAKWSYQRSFPMRVIQTTILYEEVPICGPSLYLIVVWLKWHVTRAVRDIYETAKNTKEIEQRLRDLVEYMQWKSEEMLAAYQHYFDEQRHANTQGHFHKRMHRFKSI